MNYEDKKTEKSRIILYCIEGVFAILGIIFLTLTLCGKSLVNVPKGSGISGALSSIALAFLPLIIEKLFRYRFPIMLHIIYIAYVFASVTVGSCLGLFRMDVLIMGDMMGWYDKITHSLLGYISCIVAIYLSQLFKVWGKTKSGDVLLIIAISMAIASIWEIFEFSVDHVIPGQSMQRDSLIDTMLDMTVHFATTILFVVQYLIEKCTKLNLGIDFIEKNLTTGGRVAKKIKNTRSQSDNTVNVEAEVASEQNDKTDC